MRMNTAVMKLNVPAIKKLDTSALRAQAEVLKKRFQVRSALAVTIETQRIVVEVILRDEGRSQMVRSFVLPFGADSVLSEAEKVGQELAAQLEITQTKERRCAVCVPPAWAMTATTDMPEVVGEDLQGFFELYAEREFPVSVSELRLSHCPYMLPDGKRRATLAGVPNRRLEAVERMLARAGCKAVSISLGLTRCLTRSGALGAMHFLADGDHLDVAATAGGGVVALRVLPGSIAESGAERLFPEVRITLGRLPEALRQQVREAWFMGTPETAARLHGELSVPLRRMGIESHLDAPANDGGGTVPGAAMEAAENYLRRQPSAFEFVAPQVNRWQQAAKRFEDPKRRYIAGAVIALIILPIVLFMWRSSKENHLNDEWTAMRNNYDELETIQQKIRQYRPWFDTTPQSLQIFEALATAFPDQGDVWAKSVEMSTDPNPKTPEAGLPKITCVGFARNAQSINTMLKQLRDRPGVSDVQLQSQRGENPVQFSITFHWKQPNDA